TNQRPPGRNGRLLARIGLQVVQLVARRADQTIPCVGQRVQLAPAEVIPRIERLGVDAGLLDRAGAVEEWAERSAAQRRPRRRADEVQNRRYEVDVLNGRRHPPLTAVARTLDHQRHVRRLLIEEQAVLLLAVIAEAFAVIREQDDRRSVVQL